MSSPTRQPTFCDATNSEVNFQPIRSTTQISVTTHHQYGISAVVPQTSFREETVGGVAKCQLFRLALFLTPETVGKLVLLSLHALKLSFVYLPNKD